MGAIPIPLEGDIDVHDHSHDDPITLDHFLRETFQTTTLEDSGMPSLEWLKSNFHTKSGCIRFLHLRGFEAKDIARHLGIKYQHARNVITQELKRGPNEGYATAEWGCTHTTAPVFVDIIVRHGVRDPNSSRVLLRVCLHCAEGLIPGVTHENVTRLLPGVKL